MAGNKKLAIHRAQVNALKHKVKLVPKNLFIGTAIVLVNENVKYIIAKFINPRFW